MIIQKYPKNTLMKYSSFNLLKISGLFPWKNPEACRHGQTDFVEFLLQCRGEGWGWGRGFFQKKIAHDRSDWVVWGSLRDRFLEVAPKSRNNIAWLKINPTASHSFASGGAVLVILVGSARGPSIYTYFRFIKASAGNSPRNTATATAEFFSMRWRDPFVSRALWASLMLVVNIFAPCVQEGTRTCCLMDFFDASGMKHTPLEVRVLPGPLWWNFKAARLLATASPNRSLLKRAALSFPTHRPYARTARAETEPRFTAWRATRLEERRGVLQLRWRTCAMPLSCSAPSSKVFILMRKNAELPLNVLSRVECPKP